MTGASSSRSGIACANPKMNAATISRIGFQFDRISAASAMNPSPSVWPSLQLSTDLDRQERAGQPGERARQQHALVAIRGAPARPSDRAASGFSPHDRSRSPHRVRYRA